MAVLVAKPKEWPSAKARARTLPQSLDVSLLVVNRILEVLL